MSNDSIHYFKLAASILKRTEGKPFYASDVDLEGGTMNALRRRGFVFETGNTKATTIEIYTPGRHCFKDVTAKEWQVNVVGLKEYILNAEFLATYLKALIS